MKPEKQLAEIMVLQESSQSMPFRMQPRDEPDYTSVFKTTIIFGMWEESAMKCKQNTYHPLPPTTHCPPQHTVSREAVRWVWSSSPSTVVWPSGSFAHALSNSKAACGLGNSGLWGTPPLQGSPHCSRTFLDNYYNWKGFFVFILAPKNAGFIHEQLIYSINIFRENSF